MSEKWELTDAARRALLNSLSAILPGLLARDDAWRAKYVHFAWLRINELEVEIARLRAALREIVEVDCENDVEMDAYFMHRIAKEALGEG